MIHSPSPQTQFSETPTENLLKKPTTTNPNNLTIIVFYGVSCLGKTTFTRLLSSYSKQHNINISCTSLDNCATPVIKKYRTENPDVKDKEKIWFDNWQEITALFHENILNMIKNTPKGNNILVIDDGKIDPQLLKKISNFEENENFGKIAESHNIQILALYPENFLNQIFEISPEKKIPFSSLLLLNLCYRSLNRGKHETMNYSDEKTLQIVLSFTLLYQNVDNFVKTFKKEANYSKMIQVPFISKKNDEKLNLSKFENILREAYLSIGAPFEYLKERDPTALSNLARFLRDEEEISKLENGINFADKGDWLEIFEQICEGFGNGSLRGRMEDKENDVNQSN